jgi:flagellar hook-associated protein 3 FlgL
MSNALNRLSTANMYDSALRNMTSRQTSLANLQENLTSGKRVVRASDDPVAAAQAERSMTRITRIQTEQRALELQRNAVAQAESTLGDAVGVMQQMRELVVSAGNGVLSTSDRASVASQLQGLRAQLLDVANRKDTNGVPLLSALGSAATPFLSALGGFDGLAGQMAGSAVGIPTTLDGDAAFMFQPQRDGVFHASVSAATPATHALGSSAITTTQPAQIALTPGGSAYDYQISVTYVAGSAPGTVAAQYSVTSTPPGAPLNGANPFTSADHVPGQPASIAVDAIPCLSLNFTGNPELGDTMTLALKPSASIFDTVDTAIRGLASGSASAATQEVGQALANMDRGLERLHAVRSYAGELLNRADRISGNQDTRSVQLEADRSRAEDLDMIQGISDFQNQQVGYEAALKSYAMVQKLSLFNFIS